MIRKIIIVVLTLATVASAVLWIDSYRYCPMPKRWFIGPYTCGGPGRCEFGHSIDVKGFYGWHLWFPDLGRDDSHYVCFIAPLGRLVVSWTTNSTAARPLFWLNRQTDFNAYGFGFKAWDSHRGTGNTFVAHRYEVPIWFLFALFGAYPNVALVRYVARRIRRRRQRQGNGLCVTCEYNLTGNVTGVCPECGTKL